MVTAWQQTPGSRRLADSNRLAADAQTPGSTARPTATAQRPGMYFTRCWVLLFWIFRGVWYFLFLQVRLKIFRSTINWDWKYSNRRLPSSCRRWCSPSSGTATSSTTWHPSTRLHARSWKRHKSSIVGRFHLSMPLWVRSARSPTSASWPPLQTFCWLPGTAAQSVQRSTLCWTRSGGSWQLFAMLAKIFRFELYTNLVHSHLRI